MRTITRKARNALLNHRKFTGNNTAVTVDPFQTFPNGGDSEPVNMAHLELFGNKIATLTIGVHTGKRELTITTAGWPTYTTKDRLNGLPDVDVYTHKKELHLNGSPWDGSPTTIQLRGEQ